MGRHLIAFVLIGSVLAASAETAGIAPESLIEGGHFKQLRAWAEPRVAANANDVQAAYYLAVAREAFGDLNGALPLAEKALAANANDSRYHLLVADICIEEAQKAGTFKALGLAHRFRDEASKAASLDPKYIEARESLMEFYFRAPGIAGGDKKKAWDLADEIGRIDATQGLLAHAVLAGKEKDATKQEDYLQRAVAMAPHNPKVLAQAASFYASDAVKKYEQSEKLALEAIRSDPGVAQPYVVLAGVYANLQRWNDLDATVNQSRKNVPDDFEVYYQTGKVLLTAGNDLPRAEIYFRTYLTMAPEAAEPPLAAGRWRLGQVLEKENKKSEAIAEMQEALRLQPDFKEAKEDLKRLKG